MAESKKPRRTRKASTSKTTKAAQTRQDTPDVVALTADSFVAVDQKQIVIGAATEITSDDAKVLTAVIAAGSEEGPGTIPPPSGASTGPVGWDDITDKPTEFPPEDHTHKIQDAEDYHKPFEYAFDTFQASANPNEPGEYHFQQPGIANNLAFAKEDANGAVTEAIKNLSIGSTIYLNGVAFTTKSAGGSFSGGGSVGSWFIGITEDLSAFDTSGGLTISLEAPIADGDILQWDNTDQKFKPAQLETGASSWNDLTDKPTEFPPEDHTHQIQDASDFALQPAAGVPLNNWSADNTPGPGEWNINNQFLYLPAVDSNGADQRANLRALAGQTLTITDADGTDWLMTNVSIIDELDGGHERILLDSAELETIDAGINKTGGIELTSAAFTVAELPLAEGDHLQWDATAQAFMPVQLETGASSWNDLTDKPTEFPPEAHTHTASEITDLPEAGISRIQDASDFDYQRALPQIFNRNVFASAIDDPGEYYHNTSTKVLYIHYQNSDSVDEKTELQSAFTAGGKLFYRYDEASAWTELDVVSVGDYLGRSFTITLSAQLTGSYASGIYIVGSDPTAAAPIDLAEGDHLQWDSNEQKFKPVQLETGGGGGAEVLNDLNDVETGDYNFTQTIDLSDASPKRFEGGNANSLHTDELGTWAYKVPAAANVGYGDGAFIKGAFLAKKRYQIVNLKVRQSAAFDTTNRMSLGGLKSSLTSGNGWTIYTRDTGFGWYGSSGFTEVGTRPAMAADTWYEITYVLDWGPQVDRSEMPRLSLWVDGALCVDNVLETHAYGELTGGTEFNFYLASNSTGAIDKYWADINTCDTAELPWGMSDATISDVATQLNAIVEPVQPGEALIFDGTQWRPGSAARLDGYVGMQLNDLTDVTIANEGAQNRALQIADLASIHFDNNLVQSGRVNRIYSNSAYGFALGSYISGTGEAAEASARRTYYDDSGILQNCGTAPMWIMGKLGSYTTETPEVRWSSGNPGDTNSGNNGFYVGLKLPAGIAGDTTYTFPLADGEADQVLSTDGQGALSWKTPPQPQQSSWLISNRRSGGLLG